MKLLLIACLLLKWVSSVWFFYNLIDTTQEMDVSVENIKTCQMNYKALSRFKTLSV